MPVIPEFENWKQEDPGLSSSLAALRDQGQPERYEALPQTNGQTAVRSLDRQLIFFNRLRTQQVTVSLVTSGHEQVMPGLPPSLGDPPLQPSLVDSRGGTRPFHFVAID